MYIRALYNNCKLASKKKQTNKSDRNEKKKKKKIIKRFQIYNFAQHNKVALGGTTCNMMNFMKSASKIPLRDGGDLGAYLQHAVSDDKLQSVTQAPKPVDTDTQESVVVHL